MQKAEGIENGKLKMENLGVPPARVLKKIPKSKKEQKGDFKDFKDFKALKLDVGLKKCRERREFCAKRKGESAAATGRFVIFGRGAKKNAESEANARNTRKPPPSLHFVNSEVVCRSMTQQLPAIVHFFNSKGRPL